MCDAVLKGSRGISLTAYGTSENACKAASYKNTQQKNNSTRQRNARVARTDAWYTQARISRVRHTSESAFAWNQVFTAFTPQTCKNKNENGRAVTRQDFTTNRKSVRGVSQLTDCSRQIGWRSQMMASRLTDLGQEGESSQISPYRPRGPRLKKRDMYSAFNNLSYKCGNPTQWIVGTSWL